MVTQLKMYMVQPISMNHNIPLHINYAYENFIQIAETLGDPFRVTDDEADDLEEAGDDIDEEAGEDYEV
jgi:hypothetical protein